MKSQDVLVALGLHLEPTSKLIALAELTGISVSEVHAAVARLRNVGIVGEHRNLNKRILLEFLASGIRFAFPAELGALSLGVPTGASAPMLTDLPAREVPLVWPSGLGRTRGECIEPLFPTVPEVATRDARMYELLALIETVRTGRARERGLATAHLEKLLLGASTWRLELSGRAALGMVFRRGALEDTIRKMRNEPRYRAAIDAVLLRPILTVYGEELASELESSVARGAFTPRGAFVIDGDKPSGGARVLVYPSVVDSIVGRRIVDELEPVVCNEDGPNIFLGRMRTSSLSPEHKYPAFFQDLIRSRQATDITPKSERYVCVFETDIREFYPSIDLGLARQSVAAASQASPELLSLLFWLVDTWRARTSYAPATGLPLDPIDVSRIIAHSVLQPIDRNLSDIPGSSYHRYVDDTVVLTTSKEQAREVALEHARELRALGLTPNAAKTSVLEIEEWRARRAYDGDRELDAIEESADVAALQRMIRRVSREYAKRDPGAKHLLSRLYSTAAKLDLDAMRDRAAEDVAHPDLASQALKYIRFGGANQSAVNAILDAVIGSTTHVDQRIVMARTLADAPMIEDVDTSNLAERCMDLVVSPRQDARGSAWMIGFMLLVAFKYCTRARFQERIVPWASTRIEDPTLRFFAAYAGIRDLEPKYGRALRYGLADDAQLALRLCDDVAAGAVDLQLLLKSCERRDGGRYVIPADHLPLLAIAFDEPAPWETGTCRAWIDHALESLRWPKLVDRGTDVWLVRARTDLP